MRKPFQGVRNIVRFNWHFYLIAFAVSLIFIFARIYLAAPWSVCADVVLILLLALTSVPLLVSCYVYDLSGLYHFNWLDTLDSDQGVIVNINAGFDETSVLLKAKYPEAEFIICDFYDPKKHTEVSIKRARGAYPPVPGTKQVATDKLSIEDDYADMIFVMLSAHEIRNENERQIFFKELKRVLKQRGQIIVTEHLRDVPNFLAYNIGFFHFIFKSSWKKVFQGAGLDLSKEVKLTPFITAFILKHHRITPLTPSNPGLVTKGQGGDKENS